LTEEDLKVFSRINYQVIRISDDGRPRRIRSVKNEEVLGEVIEMLGGDRAKVECEDGKERIARIPGRLKKRLWVKRGDLVALKPWKIEGDKKADIQWRYKRNQARVIKKRHDFHP